MRMSPADSDRLTRIQRRFAEFAAEHADLPLYAALCRNLAVDDEPAGLLLSARPGQARPVLWLAALHDLVLRHPGSVAAQWYPSVGGAQATAVGDPWPDVRAFALAHREELTGVIARRRTQTNEVNRAVHLAVGLAAASADLPGSPVALVELGASAGLLLGIDKYAVELTTSSGSVVLGEVASPVRCVGVDRSDVGLRLLCGGLSLPRVTSRVGIDLEPVSLNDDEGVRWLEACLWPDVPGRVERFRSARDLLRADPPPVLRGDMVELLPRAIATVRREAGPAAHVVVLSSWALDYLTESGRTATEAAIRDAALTASSLSWLTAEPPGSAPGIVQPAGRRDGAAGTIVGLRRWRRGQELPAVSLGVCHPHGQWVDLDIPFDGWRQGASTTHQAAYGLSATRPSSPA